MGWSPDKIVTNEIEEMPSAFDRISDERRAAVDEKAPAAVIANNGAQGEIQKKYQEISDRSDDHKNAVIWSRKTFSTGVIDVYTELFGDDFEDKLKKVYDDDTPDFPFTVLTEIIYDLVVRPELFIFSIYKNSNGKPSVVIAPSRPWTNKKEIVPVKFDNIIPDWLTKIKENVFEVNDDQTMAEARRNMLTHRFQEDPDLINHVTLR